MSHAAANDDAFTVDALLGGRVTLLQLRRGLRTSLDPVLLSAFVTPPFGRFLDIGCGTGALSFLLLARDAAATGTAVELQPALVALAQEGRARNGFGDRLEVRTGDVRSVAPTLGAARFDLVVTNPPFRPLAGSQRSPDEARALASHEVALTLAEWTDVAARAVRPGGRVAAVFPADRALELGEAWRRRDLAPARLRFVHSYAGGPASRVLALAERGGRAPLVIEPPLIVHEPGGAFTPEVRDMVGDASPGDA
jgi:tRNA1Val (adenine37-N6)-methyltransferase